MIKAKKVNFISQLFEKQQIDPLYKSLSYEYNKNCVYENQKNILQENSSFLRTIIAFPKFLNPEFNALEKIKVRKIIQKKQDCFGIIIDDKVKDTADYLQQQFSKSSRTPIVKKMKRLESCFHINYNVFFGAIEIEEYEYLMITAHEMIIKRFEQRNDENFILNNWDKYYKILRSLILEKKASIFVIYNNQTPIQISINFHFKKIFFAYIPAYDINYSKFGLGNTAVYKQLEWCIENEYEYLDMGNGDLEYKKRWCNHHYLLETHIISAKNNSWANLLSLKVLYLTKLKNLIKDLNLVTVLVKIKSKLKNKDGTGFIESFYTLEDLDVLPNDLNEIQSDDPMYTNLNKAICDFLYVHQDHIDNVKLYNAASGLYYIKGKTKIQKLVIEE
tara:strand:- start:2002 stop:3168 length:1167 start_codon:yes stop_codon:yes gene_type:complete